MYDGDSRHKFDPRSDDDIYDEDYDAPNDNDEPEDHLALPRRLNKIGRWSFLIFIISFNILFWYVSLEKHFSKPELPTLEEEKVI